MFGTLVNEFIPREWMTGAMSHAAHGGAHEHGTGWFALGASVLLVSLIVNAWIQKIRSAGKQAKADKEKQNAMKEAIAYQVEGMTCAHCKANVEKGLGAFQEVSLVVADPATNTVRVEADGLSDEQVRETIERLGYSFQGRQ
ncbi:MAG: cation transporter [Bacteroidales bacterium]